MAVVVLGGLVSSTLLNIFVMPLLYRWYARRTAQGDKRQRPRTPDAEKQYEVIAAEESR